jgi:hypothetical protein
MGRCRVVTPGTTRLPLSDGDWIDVVAELNAGEYVDLISALADRTPFAKILAYLQGWSLVDQAAQPLPYSLLIPEAERRDTVRALDKGTLRELVAVLDRHEAAGDAARAEKKTTPPDRPASSPISGSAKP